MITFDRDIMQPHDNGAAISTMEGLTTSIDAPGIQPSQSARIEVIGVGGGGSNAVNRMIMSDLEGVAYRVLNTDAQALIQSQAQHRLQLGPTTILKEDQLLPQAGTIKTIYNSRSF